jgi:Ca2+-binding RTX toxin-like protein
MTFYRGTDGNDNQVGAHTSMLGADGNDRLGTTTSGSIYGGVGWDFMFTQTPGATISAHGGAGNDAMHGDNGNDVLFGHEEDDLIVGGHFDYASASSNVIVIVGGKTSGADTIDGGRGRDALYGLDGNDRIAGGDGDDGGNFIAVARDTTAVNGQVWSVSTGLFGGDGDDVLDGGPGKDLLDGGNGNDVLIGGSETDAMFGGEGNDAIYADLTTTGLSGGTDQPDTVSGGGGDDLLIGNTVNPVSFNGGSGNDVVVGGNGADSSFGDLGNDTMYMGFGNDLMNGFDGDDVLFGGQGSDLYFGGTGADVFNLTFDLVLNNFEYIGDFSVAEGDEIRLPRSVQDFVSFEQSGANVFAVVRVGAAAWGYVVANATPEQVRSRTSFDGVFQPTVTPTLETPIPGDGGGGGDGPNVAPEPVLVNGWRVASAVTATDADELFTRSGAEGGVGSFHWVGDFDAVGDRLVLLGAQSVSFAEANGYAYVVVDTGQGLWGVTVGGVTLAELEARTTWA